MDGAVEIPLVNLLPLLMYGSQYLEVLPRVRCKAQSHPSEEGDQYLLLGRTDLIHIILIIHFPGY